MNSKYIICYRRNGDKITIYTSDKRKFECCIASRFLSFYRYPNDCLFDEFGIDKYELTRNLPYRYTHGNWPECTDQNGIIALLKALIKKSKIRYYEYTEI